MAKALSHLFPAATVTLFTAEPDNTELPLYTGISVPTGVRHVPCRYPTRKSKVLPIVAARSYQKLLQWRMRLTGTADIDAISVAASPLQNGLNGKRFDLILGHNIDTLPIVCTLGKIWNAKVVFDCMEFYSDMGDGQSILIRDAIEKLEKRFLPKCDLIVASSVEVANAIKSRYGVNRVIPVYNAAPIAQDLRPRIDDGRLHLYWRNSTLGLGQRGLAKVLEALTLLPPDIVLNIQGRPAREPQVLDDLVRSLNLSERVIQHPPYPPDKAVLHASRYAVGLCPELDTCRNQRLTVSNKLFDYLMGGLAVVSSDLPGLSRIVRDSGAGLLHRSGSAKDLAEKVMMLHRNRHLLAQLQGNARNFALSKANESMEMVRFQREIEQIVNR